MNGFKISKQVKLSLTACGWDLYDSDEPANSHRPAMAASYMNECFESWFNSGADRDTVREYVHNVMNIWSDTGAYDTEPRAILEKLLDEVYA